MRIKTQGADAMLGMALAIGFGLGHQAYADCPGAAAASANYCLYGPDMSTVGGDVQGTANQILAANMYPFGIPSNADYLAYWRKKALADLSAGEAYRDSLVLIGSNPNDGSAAAKLLQKGGEALNYETVGLLGDNFALAEARLIQARDTFAYQLYLGHGADEARAKLLDAVRTLASLCLMVGDEFLVDALEWRFSAEAVGLDGKLDEQIGLLAKAQTYYGKGLAAFVSGFSPAVGTNVYVSDYFGDPEYGLFNLSVERLGSALREKSSKELVRRMGSDPTEQWSDAWPQASQTLKSGALSVYLASASAARKQGASFNGADASNPLVNAIEDLRKQGNIYGQRLNPLGYDNRYIPATDFEILYSQAKSGLDRAVQLNTEFENEDRKFDYLLSSLQSQWNGLANEYISKLKLYTGCPLPDPFTDPELEKFRICTGEAGADLFDCRLSLGDSFNACVDAKTTKGILAPKYKDIYAAQLQVDAAVLNRDNILKRIEYENELANQTIQIKKDSTSAQIAYLDEYLQKLKGARSVVNTTTKTSGRKWDKTKGKWVDKEKERDYKTEESFLVQDDKLDLEIRKQEDLQKITLGFDILSITLDTEYKVKNLLLDEAAAEIAIKLAIQQKNSAIADFDNTQQEKETLWQLYQRGLAQAKPDTGKVAPIRVLRSQAAIALAEALNRTAHYTYLSAKSLEYKYTKALEAMPDVYRMSIGDIFKAQTPDDFAKAMATLDDFNKNQCPWGNSFLLRSRDISVKSNILGLDDAGFRTFISDHINADGDLQFTFSISEDASYLRLDGLYNVKIWQGPVPCGSTSTAKGVAVGLTAGLSNYPSVRLKRSGHSSLRDSVGGIHQYIPISDFHFLFESSGSDYLPSTQEDMTAFTNVDPRKSGSGDGDWGVNFKGQGLSSSDWEMTVRKGTVDMSTISDIWLYFDTTAQCCLK